MSQRVTCDLCGTVVAPHAHYVVKMEVFADPSIPDLHPEDWDEKPPAEELKKLLAELEKFSADELQDQVHRAFEFRLCPACQRAFIANPLGKPRGQQKVGEN
jgi:hypothetical protein